MKGRGTGRIGLRRGTRRIGLGRGTGRIGLRRGTRRIGLGRRVTDRSDAERADAVFSQVLHLLQSDLEVAIGG